MAGFFMHRRMINERFQAVLTQYPFSNQLFLSLNSATSGGLRHPTFVT